MRLRMLTAIAGSRWSARAGEIVEMKDEDEAARLIAAGYAIEAAVIEPPENAMIPAPMPKRRGKGKAK